MISIRRVAVLCAVALSITAAPFRSGAEAPAQRPWPSLRIMPCAVQGRRCDGPDWSSFLANMGLSELRSPTRGRAYRWLWVNQVQTRLAPVPSIGFVEVVVTQGGSGELRSAWCKGPVQIHTVDIEPFEKALAQTDFATIAAQDANASHWLDSPSEQLMEADIYGRYHFVYRVGGIREPGIQDAGLVLEALALRFCPRR